MNVLNDEPFQGQDLRVSIRRIIDSKVRPFTYQDETGRLCQGLGMKGVDEAADAIVALLFGDTTDGSSPKGDN